MPIKQRWLVGQSQLVVHTVVVGGRQYPMRQTFPPVQVALEVHWLAQAPLTQSWPDMQCAEVLQVPGTRGLQRPPWHELPAVQSLSAEQPKKQRAFTHHAPTPQSAL